MTITTTAPHGVTPRAAGVTVTATDVTVTRRGTLVLDRVSLELHPGQVTALVGHNGVGKSTLMNVLIGELAPDRGHVSYDSAALERIADLSGIVGVCSESMGLDREVSGRRALRALAVALGQTTSRADELIHAVGAESFAGRRVKRLSTGQRRKIELAAALLTDPPVLILDEPLNGLDLTAVEWFRSLLDELRGEGRTILISSHLLTELDRTADRVLVLHDTTLQEIHDLDGRLGGVEEAFRKVLN